MVVVSGRSGVATARKPSREPNTSSRVRGNDATRSVAETTAAAAVKVGTVTAISRVIPSAA